MNTPALALVDHHLSAIRTQLMLGDQRPADRFSLAGALRGMAAENLPGYERSVFRAAAEMAGEPFDPQRVRIPWSVLGRDMVVGTNSAGGYLVGKDILTPRDILRGFSVTADAGVTMIPGLTGAASVPTTTTAPTAYLFADEAGTATESTPVTGQAALTPKTIGAYCELSRTLLLASPVAEEYARNVLLGAVGAMLDKQILQGVGSNGEMNGLFTMSGLGTGTGTSMTHAHAQEMIKKSTTAGARDAELAFIGTPAVRETLSARERASGNGGFVWDGGRVANAVPGYASNECPSASLIVGPWPQVVVGMWGPGPVVELNPYAGFQQGLVGIRVLLSADFGVVNAGAFTKATSVS